MQLADDPTGDAAFLIRDMWLNGFHDDSAGNSEVGEGHWIYHEIAGVHYGLQQTSSGAETLYEFDGEAEMQEHKNTIETDEEEGI